MREEGIQFVKACDVFCKAYEFLFSPVPEIDSRHGPDAVLRCQPEEVEDTGGVVDIGKGQAGDSLPLRLGKQAGQAHRAVFKAEVGVAVEVHGAGRLSAAAGERPS